MWSIRIGEAISAILEFTFELLVAAVIGCVPVYYLWNHLMPNMFGLGKITILQAFELIVLCVFLFNYSAFFSRKLEVNASTRDIEDKLDIIESHVGNIESTLSDKA